jgi:hypothetical protein
MCSKTVLGFNSLSCSIYDFKKLSSLISFFFNELINLKFGASALYSNFTSLLLEGYSAMETAPGISFLFNILKLAVLMLFFINL